MWLLANRLILNAEKTKFMIFSKKLIPDGSSVVLNSSNIQLVDSYMFLGIYLDTKLNFKVHINHLCSKISKTMGIMYKLRNYMPSDTLKILYTSLVQSYLNYCATVWGAAYFSNIKPIYMLQKKIIRIITNSDYLVPSLPLFRQLEILNIFDLCKFNILKFFYRITNGNNESFLYFKRLLSDEHLQSILCSGSLIWHICL